MVRRATRIHWTLLVSLLLLAGCPKAEPQPPVVTAPPPGAAPAPAEEPAADSDLPLGRPELNRPAGAADPGAGNAGGTTNAGSASDSGSQAADPPRHDTRSDGPPPTYNDEQLNKELEDLRPKKEKERKGQKVDIEFETVAHNSTPGAKVSDLTFSIRNTSNAEQQSIKLTDKDPAPAGKLSLGWCTVKVRPQLAGPVSQPIGGGTRSVYEWLGRYRVDVFDANSKLLCELLVDHDGVIQAGENGPGYGSRVKRDPDSGKLTQLTVKRMVNEQLKDEVLIVRWDESGFTRQSTIDAKGNRFEYKFPAGRLELVPPEAND